MCVVLAPRAFRFATERGLRQVDDRPVCGNVGSDCKG